MREKLILAAIERFGKQGFDGVGTREIASAVGTTMSSITYHFGGKEGLYIAAAEHIFDQLHEQVFASIDSAMPELANHEQQRDAICLRLCTIGQFMLRDESAPFALFIGREQQSPSPGVLNLLRGKMLPMLEVTVAQVKRLRPDLDDRQARAVTLFLFGMAITLRHSRASLRILLDIDEIDPETAAMLLDQLDQSARRLLTGGAA